MSTCQSSVPGYTGVYDLSGNVFEWEDSCFGAQSGASTYCIRRGGSFCCGSGYMQCGDRAAGAAYDLRSSAHWFVGFRCCSP
jgi:formylglycine-generating enzyme